MKKGIYTKYIKYELWILDILLKILVFEKMSLSLKLFGNVGNVFVYCWCVLYYKLLLLMRVSD